MIVKMMKNNLLLMRIEINKDSPKYMFGFGPSSVDTKRLSGRFVSTEEGPSPNIYFGLSLFISIRMSKRLFFIILTIILIMLSITFRFIKSHTHDFV